MYQETLSELKHLCSKANLWLTGIVSTVFCLSLVGLIVIRGFFVASTDSIQTALTSKSLVLNYVYHEDGLVIAAILALIGFSFLNLSSKWPSWLRWSLTTGQFGLRVAAGIYFFLATVDVLLIENLHARIVFRAYVSMSEILWRNIEAYFNFKDSTDLLIIICLALILKFFIFTTLHHRWQVILAWGLAVLLSIGWLFTHSIPERNTALLPNFLFLAQSDTSTEPYSAAFINKLKSRPATPLACSPYPARKPNIILIVLESYSNYQSKNLLGVKDLTPKLDQWMTKDMSYPHFLANFYRSAGGYVSLLTGLVPFHTPDYIEDYTYHINSEVLLPKILKHAGYDTLYVTGFPIRQTFHDDWLTKIGMNQIVDRENFPGLNAYSAPDEKVFNKALSLINTEQQPYFMMLSTASSHLPYVEPISSKPSSEAAVLNYVDNSASHFLSTLKQEGKLNNTLVIIASDHRAMTPLLPSELATYGPRSVAAIPMIVIDHGKQHVFKQLYSQIDIPYSLAAMVTGKNCTNVWHKNIFEAYHGLHCSAFQMGTHFHKARVFCSDGKNYNFVLSGDNTHAVGGDAPQWMLDYINRQRLLLT